MEKKVVESIARYLFDAEKQGREVEKFTLSIDGQVTVEEAYAIQRQLIALKIAEGQQVYAPKLGLTSPAKMKQMHVDSPIYGYVFDYMLVNNQEEFSLREYIHPKVEPEISVVLKKELQGPGVTLQEVEDNLDYVVSSLEIIDSRYQNYQFTLADVIADNSSAKGAVYSQEAIKLTPKEIITETAKLKINGQLIAEGSGIAVLGNPLETIVFLANELGKQGKVVPAKVPIMTGGMTVAEKISTGDLIEVEYATLGKIRVRATV